MKFSVLILKFTLVTWLVFSASTALAQFDPEKLVKSVVRITVTGGGKKASAATGFVWLKPNQIVTSLHLMRAGNDVEITVEQNKKRRLAKVSRVLQSADLVLLEVYEQPIPNWTVLNSFEAAKPKTGSQIIALGFNAGAPGSSTRQLKKGFASPEILKGFLPPGDRAEIEKAGIPHITLPIYYLEGSLLPGFSGAPVVDSQGRLIGIGDGGLENGASNVSWVIPASNLDLLTSSNVRSLPGTITSANQAFSADLEAPEKYRAVEVSGYEFVKTKTRSFLQLLETTDDPVSLEEIATSFLSEFQVDYLSFEYDIYEDINHGLIIALPAGINLVRDEDGELTAAYDEESPYSIDYKVLSVDDIDARGADPEAMLNHLADEYLEEINEDEGESYVEFDDARYIDGYGNNQFVLRSAFNDLHNDLVEDNGVDYITFATNLETIFLSRGVMNRFDAGFIDELESMLGLNCSGGDLYDNEARICDELEKMLLILTSVHLTSFANTSKSRLPGQ